MTTDESPSSVSISDEGKGQGRVRGQGHKQDQGRSQDRDQSRGADDHDRQGPPRRFVGRGIVSFVRRSSRLDKRLEHAWKDYAPDHLLDFGQADHELGVPEDFVFSADLIRQTWGNDHPLIVEIGSGQGENAAAAALAHPGVNYLALEVYKPGVAHTLLLAGKNGLSNLRIAQVNAPELFARTEAGSISEVWTFFPDPWPKTKHHKRRIVQEPLISHVGEALASGGVWRIATDIGDYALHVHEMMDGRDDFSNIGTLTVSLPIEHVSKGTADQAYALPHADFQESHRFEGRILTNFEKKGIKAGRAIHDFTYRIRK
ncbi:MAG: tRNA (guanosine(46)-N7)-methyltransferase TrmB [Parascardovia denticolens]